MLKPAKLVVFILLSLIFVMTATAYNVQFADSAKSQPLVWKSKKIPISFSRSLVNQSINNISEDEILKTINASLKAWEDVAQISFEQSWTDDNSISSLGKSGDGINLITIAQTTDNLILFSGDASENAARTRVFFNRQGNITEADIVLNPYARFSTDGSTDTFDLESVLIHEIGHLLGLEHSTISSATMFEQQGKNGVYNLNSFSPRTLSEDDISGIRSIYGANSQENNCCGSIKGNISVVGKLTATETFRVFAENAENGNFIADVSTDESGNYRFDGLKAGNYILYTKSNRSENSSFQKIGKIEVSHNKISLLDKKIKISENKFDLQFAGFNAQISNLSVPLNSGKSYTLYIAGKNLDIKNSAISINSPYISINPDSLKTLDYGSNYTVLSFEILLQDETPKGDYSISYSNKFGNKDYLFGCFSVEEMSNPWQLFTF